MSMAALPFDIPKGHAHKGGPSTCPIFKLLPEPLQREAEANSFLLDYIHMLPVEQFGVPEFYSELTRNMGDIKTPT